MRIPFKTETDAFRVAALLCLLAGLAILVGWLTTRPYGIVVFFAGLAAGITFELVGREADADAALNEALWAAHAHGAAPGRRHVLVIAEEVLEGDALAAELRSAGASAGEGEVELDVLAPVLPSRTHHFASDTGRERAEAQARLEASLAWAAAHGLTARGAVGDDDAMVAIEDELRDFGAHEVIIVAHARQRTSWLARRMLTHLQRALDIPVREIVVGDEAKRGLHA